MMLSRRTLLKLVAAGAVPAFALCGCAHPQMIDLGSTESQVVEKLGKPDSITAMPDGTTRYTYSLQPEGQEVWWMFFDKNGRFVKREQALVEENFYRLIKPGKTTIADVYRLFGHCTKIFDFKLLNQSAYMYRFQDASRSDVVLWVQYGRDNVVTERTISEDPRKNTRFPIY